MQRKISGRLPFLSRAALTVGIALAATSGFANADMEKLRNCTQIADAIQRLACYDTLALEMDQVDTAPAAAPPEPAEFENPSVDQSSSARNEGEFGLETTQQHLDQMVDSITARLVGNIEGWSGSSYFRLDNGQVWQQSDSSRAVFKATNPQVTIKRGAFGSYWLTLEGLNRSVRVRRVE